MTDFLNTLVDRALDRAPVLERRRPSRFEHAPVAARFEPVRSEGLVPEMDEEGNSETPGKNSIPAAGKITPPSTAGTPDDSAHLHLERLDLDTIRPARQPFPASQSQSERPDSGQ